MPAPTRLQAAPTSPAIGQPYRRRGRGQNGLVLDGALRGSGSNCRRGHGDSHLCLHEVRNEEARLCRIGASTAARTEDRQAFDTARSKPRSWRQAGSEEKSRHPGAGTSIPAVPRAECPQRGGCVRWGETIQFVQLQRSLTALYRLRPSNTYAPISVLPKCLAAAATEGVGGRNPAWPEHHRPTLLTIEALAAPGPPRGWFR